MTIKWKHVKTSDMRFYNGTGPFALYAVQNDVIVAIVPLFEWRDFNTDGHVAWTEWAESQLPMVSHMDKGMLASIYRRIQENEPNPMTSHAAGVESGVMLSQMGFAMIKDGIKEVYVKPLVALAGGKWGLSSSSGQQSNSLSRRGWKKLCWHP